MIDQRAFSAEDHPANRETARLIAQKNWADTPLGVLEGWPQSLGTAVGVMLDSPVAMVILWGPDLVQIYNDGYADIIGWKHPTGLGQRHRECWPEAWEFTNPVIHGVLAGQVRTFRDQVLRLHRHGLPEECWFDLNFGPLADDAGVIAGVVVTLAETTDRVRTEAALRANERRLAIAVEASRGGVFEQAVPIGPELFVSSRWCEILGFAETEVPGWQTFQSWHDDRIHSDDRPIRDREFLGFVNGDEPGYELEFRMKHKTDGWIWVREFAQATERRADGSVAHLSGLMLDITDRKTAERDAEQLDRHDPLTRLPNRTLLQDRLGALCRDGAANGGKFGLVLVDLDEFKSINASQGEEVGDGLLQTVARRIRAVLRKGDTLARLGSDEFALLLPSVRDAEDVDVLLRRIRDSLRRPATVFGQTVALSASFGAAIFPGDGRDRSDLMRHADLALEAAKDAGRGEIRFFESAAMADGSSQSRTEVDLRRAIELDQLMLHFQPQFDLRTGEVRSAEALVRWRKSAPETIFPGQFMDVAEASGLILPMGEWVLREAAAQAAQWREQGFDAVVAVNLSPAEASRPEFLDTLDRTLAESGLSPQQVELEVAEALMVAHQNSGFEAFVQGCRSRGVRLVIDDFGVDRSTVDRLADLPAGKIKIDRSIVAGIGERECEALIAEIVEAGRRLDRRVVAEGVETEAQLAFLRKAGCDDAQGILLCPPGEAYMIQDRLIVGLPPAREEPQAEAEAGA